MWIFLNNSFLSIVCPDERKGPADPRKDLVVRARIKGDIERVFPKAKVTKSKPKERDYQFRAVVSRASVADAIAAEVHRIDYTNFKGSIPMKDHKRYGAYMSVWSAMASRYRSGVYRHPWMDSKYDPIQ